MNYLNKNLENKKDAKVNLSNKVTTLNPNAAEYVPSALRSIFENTRTSDATRTDVPKTSAKVVLDRSESAVSSNSDDEARQYWCHQLPDDITPDFTVIGEAELPGPDQFSPADLSIHDARETSRFSSGGLTLGIRHDRTLGIDNHNLNGKLGYSGSPNAGYRSSAAFMASGANSQTRQFKDGALQLTGGIEGHHFSEYPSAGFVHNLLGDRAIIEDAAVKHMEFLASQFPGLTVESLEDVYYSNGCDLNLAIKMLKQLELHGDGGFGENLNSEALNAPSFTGLEFLARPMVDAENGLSKYNRDLHQAPNIYRSSSGTFRGASSFASTVRKLASQDSGHWKYERNGSIDGSVGSSGSSQLLASPYNGHVKLVNGGKSRSFSAKSPTWLTGDAMANMYSEIREETHDLAHLRDSYFEQANKASLFGNKALAREMSDKGHLYGLQMKAAQGKMSETIYRQRNPIMISSELQGYSRGQDPTIDLDNLHVNEAMQVLKHELNQIKSTARSSSQRLQVRILLGSRYPNKGLLSPTYLPVVVEQYLLEEGLQYTKPQPGLLLVVIY